MKPKTIAMLMLCTAGITAYAQKQEIARAPVGAAPARTEFVSYDLRDKAETHIRERSSYFVPLTQKLVKDATSTSSSASYSTTVDIPIMWTEREIFLHIEGAWSCCLLYVDGRPVGYAEDSQTPVEFNISKSVKDGANKITIEVHSQSGGALLEQSGASSERQAGLREVYLYSQPRLRIEDYKARAIDNHGGRLYLDIALSNGFNYPEKISVGYDIYDPTGKLVYYDKREIEIPGNGRDTLSFDQEILGIGGKMWSPASPKLYKMMLIVWRNGHITEYVPFNVGFSDATLQTRLDAVAKALSEKKIAIYNAPHTPGGSIPVIPPAVKGKPASKVAVAPDYTKARTDFAALKKQGITVLTPGYPQPGWFYDLCDELGFYVIDQANINCPTGKDDRKIGGTPSNNPAYLPAYMDRTERMYARMHNHPCIIAWSLGGQSGNGYNMYKTYEWLKTVENLRPVIYPGVQSEWNSDL